MTFVLIGLFVAIMWTLATLLARIFAPTMTNSGIITDRNAMRAASRRIQNNPNYRPCGK